MDSANVLIQGFGLSVLLHSGIGKGKFKGRRQVSAIPKNFKIHLLRPMMNWTPSFQSRKKNYRTAFLEQTQLNELNR